MKSSPSTRRNFLGNIAILSVGAAFGNVTKALPVLLPEEDLERQWNRFCQQHNAGPASLTHTGENNIPAPGNGHVHETGALISFPAHGLLARPTWIYWNKQKRKAADVIITFFDSAGEKQFRLNRFELAALSRLAAEAPSTDTITLLKESARSRFLKGVKAPLSVQAKISRGQQVHIRTRLFQNETSTSNQFIVQV